MLEGGVRRAGDTLRVTVRLTQASDGSHLWSERFDRDAGDIFAVQDEIARAVVAALRGALAAPVATLVRRPTDNLDAYALYLQGRFHWSRRTVADARRSLEFFEQALSLDPSYAHAHLGVADAWFTLALYGGAAPHEAMSRAKAAAERALLFNPALAEAEATLGSIHGLYDWSWTEADVRFARAVALTPGSCTAHHWRAMHSHLPLGRFAEAEQALRHALSLDPLSMAIQASLGLVLHFAGRGDDAVGVLQAAIASDPGFAVSHMFLGEVLVDQGRGRAAVDAFETSRRLSPSDPKPLAGLVQAHALLEEMTAARARGPGSWPRSTGSGMSRPCSWPRRVSRWVTGRPRSTRSSARSSSGRRISPGPPCGPACRPCGRRAVSGISSRACTLMSSAATESNRVSTIGSLDRRVPR